MSTLERRFVTGEVRAVSRGSQRIISGYAARFNSPSSPLLGFIERCKPGCFSRAIREGQNVMCLQNHNVDLIMGRTKNGTLSLREDNLGLYYECILPETQQARDLHALIARHDISGCSFSFNVKRDQWGKERFNGELMPSRDLLDVDLNDVGPVCQPAYEETSVTARSEDEDDLEKLSLQEVERCFPSGIPSEIRSHIVVPKFGVVSASERRRLEMRVRLSLSE
jgi:uncharacterized protein